MQVQGQGRVLPCSIGSEPGCWACAGSAWQPELTLGCALEHQELALGSFTGDTTQDL